MSPCLSAAGLEAPDRRYQAWRYRKYTPAHRAPAAPPAPRAPNQTRQLPAIRFQPQQLRKAGADDKVIVYKGNGDHGLVLAGNKTRLP